jgi:hypothetical protein
MTPAALEAIRERLAKATPGPWQFKQWRNEGHLWNYLISTEGRKDGDIGTVGLNYALRVFGKMFGQGPKWGSDPRLMDKKWVAEEFNKPNAALIASAPTDLQACLSHIDALREALAAATEMLENSRSGFIPGTGSYEKAERERAELIAANRRALGDQP